MGSGRFLNAHDQTLSKHVERLLDPRQFGGVSGIEHPPNLLLVATEFSCQLHIGDSGLSHCEIEGRFRSDRCRDGNQPFAPRCSRRLRDLPPSAILPAIASSRQSAACQSASFSPFPCVIASDYLPCVIASDYPGT